MARQNFVGLVVSQGKMNKTVKVRVQRTAYDRVINKDMIKRKDYLVHDEANICREGDIVRIEATRPLSKKKFFAVAEIKRNQGSEFATYEQEAQVIVHQDEVTKHDEFLQRKTEFLKPSLIENLYKIEKLALSTPEDKYDESTIKEIEALKSKYGINTWPPKEKLVDLEVENLQRELKSFLIKFDSDYLIKSVMEDQDKINLILQKMSKDDVTKKSIQRNLIRKFIKTTPTDELKELGLYEL